MSWSIGDGLSKSEGFGWLAVQGALLRQLIDGPLVLEGVNERLDPSLDTGGDPAGHRVAGRRGAAGLLGGRPGHETLLVAELKDIKGGGPGGAEGGDVSVNNSRAARGDRSPDQSLLLLDCRRPRLICQDIVNQLYSLCVYLNSTTSIARQLATQSGDLQEREKWKSSF